MRILEISGRNLASLKGEFCIALDQPPFLQKGLFAIRGATGSGKSTIIDAMCLALYGCTPRFEGYGGPKVGPRDLDGTSRVSASDPRSILQRGASEGWAQVKFRGVDGHTWRAKWSVSRARKNPHGTLQKDVLEVEDLTIAQVTRANKTDVLTLIRSKVGLTFEQFRRSVLLAQGEFAAFTKASSADRAALLEAMTGTEIYAKVSMAVFRRSAAEDLKIKELRSRLEGLGVWSEEERTEVLLNVERVAGRILEQEQAQTQVGRDLDWHEQSRNLVRQVLAAEVQARTAQAAWDNAGDRSVWL